MYLCYVKIKSRRVTVIKGLLVQVASTALLTYPYSSRLFAMPLLRIHIGPDNVVTHTLSRKVCTIGRGEKNDIVVDNHKVSRLHARIVLNDDGYYLVDCNSSNGIWSSAGRINKMKLVNECTFTIGNAEFSFWEEENTADAEPTKMVVTQYKRIPSQGVIEAGNLYLALLQEIIVESGNAQDRNELFDLVDDIAAEALEGDRCAVFLPSPEGWVLWPPHKIRLRARFGATPFSQTVFDAMRDKAEPLLCSRESEQLPRSDSMTIAGVSSAMAAPMRVADNIHGMLYVDRLGKKESFSQQDLAFLTAVANQLAISIENQDVVMGLKDQVERYQDEKPKEKMAIIGNSAAIKGAINLINNINDFTEPVLICGEAGTGRTHLANAIHDRGPHADEPIQSFNCSSMDPDMVAVRLFGGTREGQFNDSSIPGFFELANGGTALLEDIHCIDAYTQKKLLHMLETGEVIRCGHTTVRKVNIHLIATTTPEFNDEEEKLEPELLKHFNTYRIDLPKLIDRQEDIDLLIKFFLAESCKNHDIPIKQFTPEAQALLISYNWPGNLTQLQQIIEQVVIKSDGPTITPDVFPDSLSGNIREESDFRMPLLSLADMEKIHIERVLEHYGGNKKACAEHLGINRSTLYAKLRLYNID